MKRREFLALLGGTAAAWPLPGRAQQGERMRRLAVFLNLPADDPEAQRSLAALRQGLAALGWIEGRNIHIDFRWATDDPNTIRSSAAELVRLAPDVILASATDGLAAFQQETQAIPIVFVSVSDPVGQGFVTSLARPGGNITGFTAFEFSMGGKWIETLKEIAPSIRQVAVLFNPTTAPYFALFLRSIEAAAATFSVQSVSTPVQSVAEIETAIMALARTPNVGLICPSDSYTSTHRKTIILLAARNGIPAVFSWREFVSDGALVTYGIDRIDMYRQAPPYIDRILKGAKPADLPVQQPTKFELAISLKTAKALGLDVPAQLLARADEVIE
jgi:putative tryptophan/tyrosine transport system substrate-binding protein